MFKCHYSATIFVAPDQIFQVASDLMEKYCNSEKALHAMFGQRYLPLVEQNTSKAQVAVDIREAALPLNQKKVDRRFLPSPLSWFSCE